MKQRKCGSTELNSKLYDSGWVKCAMGNGIQPYSIPEETPSVRRLGKEVYLRGVVRNNTSWKTHDSFITIPSGFRPPYKAVFVMQGSSSFRYNITVYPSGKVTADRYSNNTTMNNTVPIGAWLNMYCSWTID